MPAALQLEGRSISSQATTNHTFAASLLQARFWTCIESQEDLAVMAYSVLLPLHTSKQDLYSVDIGRSY
ncbi:hypothetical protein WJX77_004241 [Trebouxia sp. C0004]